MATLKNSLEEVKEIICDFSYSTGLATVMVDVQGNEISERYNFSDFCEKIRSDHEHFQVCKNCDRLGGINALRENRIRCYTCHAGLVDFSVPLLKNGNLLGFIQCGQAKVDNQNIPHIEQYKKSLFNQSSELRLLHNKIDTVTNQKIDSSVRIISRLVNNDIYQALSRVEDEELFYGDDIVSVKSLNYQIHINKAQQFVQNNLNNNVSLEHVANHVQLSPQYFCRIFKKDTGMGFSQYVNTQRLALADRLLKEGTFSIEEIAKASGYSSSSYFIKQFKNHFNMTPRAYRQLHHEERD